MFIILNFLFSVCALGWFCVFVIYVTGLLVYLLSRALEISLMLFGVICLLLGCCFEFGCFGAFAEFGKVAFGCVILYLFGACLLWFVVVSSCLILWM